MSDESTSTRIEPHDFARRFQRRAANLMWLLGAGASASAGVPTAWDMIWEFKQLLYVSQRKVSLRSVADLSSPRIRTQLQEHIDRDGSVPAVGAPDEYAVLFEKVYPAEADRRTFLDAKMAGAKPSYGHMAIATLMRAQLTRLLWTTNFDPLVADACAKVFGGTGALGTVGLDAPELASQLISDGRWPIEIKLHGDFRSRRLKNTDEELRHQDAKLRQVFIDSCRRFGLIVAGYSGRDESIMSTLEAVFDHPTPFPAGLFWLHRGEAPPLPRVAQLISRAREKGIEASIVSIDSFDEVMRDLMRLIQNIDTKSLDEFALERRRWSAAPRLSGAQGWPVLRLNALHVDTIPVNCRLVVCKVGGVKEVKAAVESVRANVLATRVRTGVLAFGADAEVRRAFTSYDITEFDLYTIEAKRLRYDSAERGLLRTALSLAICRARGLDVVRRRSHDLFAPTNPDDAIWSPLKRLVGSVHGSVKGHSELKWREGIATRLDWADDRLVFLVEPSLVFDGIENSNKAFATDFARERSVKRYNRQLNELIVFWSALLSRGGAEMRTFGIGDGIDATFKIGSDNCFSRRCRT